MLKYFAETARRFPPKSNKSCEFGGGTICLCSEWQAGSFFFFFIKLHVIIFAMPFSDIMKTQTTNIWFNVVIWRYISYMK